MIYGVRNPNLNPQVSTVARKNSLLTQRNLEQDPANKGNIPAESWLESKEGERKKTFYSTTSDPNIENTYIKKFSNSNIILRLQHLQQGLATDIGPARKVHAAPRSRDRRPEGRRREGEKRVRQTQNSRGDWTQ